MGRWQNFSIWRGRLPHWRADDVRYYVTFRHRRPLDDGEQRELLRALLGPEGSRWEILILCVLPEATEALVTVRPRPDGSPYELSDVVERAKRKAGQRIIKATGERYPPFYAESFDRIVRDDAELEGTWQRILDSPVTAELTEEAEEWPGLFVAGAPG